MAPTVRLLGITLLALLVATCGGSGQVFVPPQMLPGDYQLGPGDAFKVSVYGMSDLTGEFRVAEDGTISFPLVGTVMVAGLGSSGVEKAIQSALVEHRILTKPHVSVYVTEQTSKRVNVLGAVKKPGSFPMTIGMSVLEAISLAGGFTALARPNETIVTRVVKNSRVRFRVPVEDVAHGQAEDVELQPGDAVFVPERIF